MTNVLLTGATGFLGRTLTRQLREAGYRLTVTQRTPPSAPFPPDVNVVEIDLVQADNLAGLPENIDVVIHAAALIPARFDDWTAADALWRANGLATLQLASWAKSVGVKRFVYCSSYAVYQRPLPPATPETHPVYPTGAAAPYALSKLAGEAFAIALTDENFTVSGLRFSAIYGGGMVPSGVLTAFIERARQNHPIVIQAHPETLFDFVHVSDAAQAVARCVERPLSHQVYNVGGGQGVSLPRLAETVWSVFAPERPSLIEQAAHPAKPATALLDIRRAQQDLGYVPAVDLTAGLLEMKRHRL